MNYLASQLCTGECNVYIVCSRYLPCTNKFDDRCNSICLQARAKVYPKSTICSLHDGVPPIARGKDSKSQYELHSKQTLAVDRQIDGDYGSSMYIATRRVYCVLIAYYYCKKQR